MTEETVCMSTIFRRSQKDQKRIIDFLDRYNILPINIDITDSIWHMSLYTLKFLIGKGIKLTVEMANIAAEWGDIKKLEVFEKSGILPDSRGTNKALEHLYHTIYIGHYTGFSVLKWMYKRKIVPTDNDIIRRILGWSSTK